MAQSNTTFTPDEDIAATFYHRVYPLSLTNNSLILFQQTLSSKDFLDKIATSKRVPVNYDSYFFSMQISYTPLYCCKDDKDSQNNIIPRTLLCICESTDESKDFLANLKDFPSIVETATSKFAHFRCFSLLNAFTHTIYFHNHFNVKQPIQFSEDRNLYVHLFGTVTLPAVELQNHFQKKKSEDCGILDVCVKFELKKKTTGNTSANANNMPKTSLKNKRKINFERQESIVETKALNQITNSVFTELIELTKQQTVMLNNQQRRVDAIAQEMHDLISGEVIPYEETNNDKSLKVNNSTKKVTTNSNTSNAKANNTTQKVTTNSNTSNEKN